MRAVSLALFLPLCACGSGSDAGSGSNTLLVDADIEATPEVSRASDAADFTTSLRVRVTLGGVAVSAGEVTVSSEGGDVALIWDPSDDGGRWRGSQAGYFASYALDVSTGDDFVHGVELDGPDIHVFTSPDGSAAVDATQPLTVSWSRDQEADDATIETREMDQVAIADLGTFELPAGTLRSDSGQTEEDEIRLMRAARIVPAGAVAGSELRVRIENRVDVVVMATGP